MSYNHDKGGRAVSIKERSGWILPNGKYAGCFYGKHEECARKEIGMKYSDLEVIAVRISFDFPRERDPDFFLPRNMRISRKQKETLKQYCLKFKCIPQWWILSNIDGWDCLKNMSKEDALSFLKTR